MRRHHHLASSPAVLAFAAFTALTAFLPLMAAPEAQAQSYRNGPPPRHRLVYSDLTLVRLNPLGLITDARLTYRYRLYKSESVAFRDNFLALGVAPTLSGGFARIGPTIEIQPASFLKLWALYEVVGWFGVFNFMQSYPSIAGANYSDTELSRRGDLPSGDPAKNYPTGGTQLLLGGTLQFKVGPVAARNQIRVGRPNYKLRDGDRAFYDIYYDLLTGDRGWFYANDTDLLYQAFNARLSVGVRWSTARSFYRPEHFAPGDDQNVVPGAIHRLGPIAAWTFKKPDGAKFEPTVILIANWWLKSPYRTGQDVSQALPYFVAAVNISGDLWPGPSPKTRQKMKRAKE